MGNPYNNPSPLFPQLLSSRDLIARVLSRKYTLRNGQTTDLMAYMKIKGDNPDRTLQQAAGLFRSVMRSGYDIKSGVTTISASFRDPVLAAAVVNACTEELDRFIQDLRASQAGEKVRFISQRLTEVQQQLGDAENSLKAFRERNRQILGAPQLMLEETRLIRDVTVNEQLFLTLKTQHEIARIEEVRNLPDIMVLEKAVAPIVRDAPLRKRIVFMWTIGFGFLSLVAVFVVEFGRGIWAKSGLRGGRSSMS